MLNNLKDNDNKIEKALLAGTDEAALLKDIVWKNIENKLKLFL